MEEPRPSCLRSLHGAPPDAVAARFALGGLDQKSDFPFLARLGARLAAVGACSAESQSESLAVLIGGVNRGQLAHALLDSCAGLTFVGAEIAPLVFDIAAASFPAARYPHTTLINTGFSDKEGTATYSGVNNEEFEGFSLFDARKDTERRRFSDWSSAVSEVAVLPLTTVWERHIRTTGAKLVYTVVDTEGHEPLVVKGMQLGERENRAHFSAFQIELGGTWASGDPRHPRGSASQQEVAELLENLGYLLFLVGDPQILPLTSGMLSHPALLLNEGFGDFVQGNLLAIHPDFAHEVVSQLVCDLAWRSTANRIAARRE